jgi:BioD-like phosphotransacetylase family protein
VAKRVYIAATFQNEGKTTLSLGLIEAFKARGLSVGFIKPVGQRYVEQDGDNVDEDSVVIADLCGVGGSLKDMSPVTVARGFTEWYIRHGEPSPFVRQIHEAFDRVADGKDIVVVEGTGHAGVGSCFDLSNAAVASMLKAGVVIISSGGIGRPIDEIMVNVALFQKEEAPVVGAVLNKVLPAKHRKVSEVVELGLKRQGLRLLGCLPHNQLLSVPTVGEVQEEIDLSLLCGDAYLDRRVGKILVGAMEPHDALAYFEPGCLIITPGGREDMITATISWHLLQKERGSGAAGLILTGGQKPRREILHLLRQADIPTLLSETDTFAIASAVHGLTIKTKPGDHEKKAAAVQLVAEHVDVDALLDAL